MSSAASPAPMMNRSNFQRPSPMGGGMEFGDRQMPQPLAPRPSLGAMGAFLAQRPVPAPPNITIPQPTQVQEQPMYASGFVPTSTANYATGLLQRVGFGMQEQQPVMPSTTDQIKDPAFGYANAQLGRIADTLQRPSQAQQQPIMPPTGAQANTKMGGGYPAMPNAPTTSPVSGDPGMAGGGMTSTTQPVGVAVPVDVQPFIAGRDEFMGGGSYGAPARGSDLMPENYADLYGGRFGRGR